MPIRAILTDFGSVLVQMVNETPRRQLAERWNLPLDHIYQLVFYSETAAQAVLGEIPVSRHWGVVLESLQIPPEQHQAFIEQFWAADGLNQPFVDYLRGLHRRYPIGLLSNANDDLRQVLAARWQIDDLFDQMIISAEVGLAKPDPRIYRLAVDSLGVQPEEMIFIDDMPGNVEAACAVGLHAIQFRDNDQVFAELNALVGFL